MLSGPSAVSCARLSDDFNSSEEKSFIIVLVIRRAKIQLLLFIFCFCFKNRSEHWLRMNCKPSCSASVLAISALSVIYIVANREMFNCRSIRSTFNSMDHIPDLIHGSSIINRRNNCFHEVRFFCFIVLRALAR